MAGVKTEITIDVDYTGHREARKAIRDFHTLDRVVKKSAATFASTSGGTRGPGGGGDPVKYWGRLRKQITEFDKAASMAAKIGLKGLSLAMKGATLEMAAMAVAMLGVHAAFVLGNGVMKAMRALQGPLAAGLAGVVAAASAAAAAIRENQAAMYAYKTTTKGQFGSTLNQTRQVMRSLHADTYLATAGVESLNKAFAAVSKNSTWTMKSQKSLRGLMDFASAGQPLDQGIQKAGELIAALQNAKTTWSETKVAAEALFPDKQAMEKAMKKLKISTKKGLQKAIDTGSLAKEAGVEGQFEQVSGTLINKLKGYFNLLKVQFADMGQPLLEPIKVAAEQIFRILRRGFVKVQHSSQVFGMGSMLDGLVSMVQKVMDKMTTLINNHVGTVEGIFDRMGNWWDRFRDGWDTITDKLRPLIGGAKVIEGFFGQVFKHVKNIFSSKFGDFNKFLMGNEGEIKELGNGIGQLLENIFALTSEFTKLQQKLLPFVNALVKGLGDIVGHLASVMKALNSLGSGPMGALAILLTLRGGMKGAQEMHGRGGYKMVMVNGKKQMVPDGGPTAPPTGPTVVTGPPTGGLGTTHATPPGTPTIPIPPIPPIGPTPPPTPPGTPAFPSSRRTPLQRPEYEVFKRAPKGGINIGGKFYKGGSFLPTSQITSAEQSYFNIEGIGRPGKMQAMTDVATETGMVSMRAGTPVAPAAAAAASSAAVASAATPRFDKAGRPIAPVGGVDYNGKHYPQGKRLPDSYIASGGFASATGTGPGPTPPIGPPSPPATPPTTPPTRRGRFVNNLQSVGTTGGTFIKGLKKKMDGPDMMWLPGAGGGEGEMRDVAGMTDEEFRQAKTYNRAFGEGAYKDGKLPSSGGSGELTRRAKLQQRAIENRTKMDSYRGRQYRAALGSQTAKMGTSMVLGMGSQFMPEEAQGAMAAGAAVGQMNPLAGIAVAGLGTAMNARTAGGGAVSGAMGGAAAGAMLGSVVPVIGTATGAIVGTLVGAVGGFVMGALNAQEIKAKKARAVAQKQIDSIINTNLSMSFRQSAQEAALGGRDKEGNEILSSTRTMFDNPMKKMEELSGIFATDGTAYRDDGSLRSSAELAKLVRSTGSTFSDQDMKDVSGNSQEYANKMQKESAANLAAMDPIQKKYNARLDELKRMTGKTDQEIIDLASSVGVNLGDATMDFTVMVEELGVAMVKTSQEMKGLTQSIVIDSASVYDAAIKKITQPQILDELATTFVDSERAGGTTTKEKLEFLGSATEQMAALYGSGGVGQAEIERQIGGGKFFDKGNVGEGLARDTFTKDSVVMDAYNEQKLRARTQIGNTYGQQINNIMKERGFGQSIDVNAFTEQFKGLSTEEMSRVSKFMEGDAAKGVESMDMSGYTGTKVGAEAIFDYLKIDPALLRVSEIGANAEATGAIDLSEASEEIKNATTKLIGQMDEFFRRDKENTPEWFTKEAFEALIADTSTPRGGNIGDTTSSKLATTMGRHSAMDASLTGKRTVTSSYRTTGLGSVNSDHVTGRAYDLVGQNLGQYQTLAKAGGGFAEFHGTNASRHLHVVPGPGAIGDNSTPVASSNKQPSMAMSGGGGDTNYSFHIQGGNNASPQEIANLVIMKVKEIERSNRERS